jgi:plasmid maintenance system antidote protein VapI
VPILARVFGNSPDFWLNLQRRNDLWDAMHSPQELERIERAKPLKPLRDENDWLNGLSIEEHIICCW